MFHVEQEPKKNRDKCSQTETNDAAPRINYAEMLREQNNAFQRNSGSIQTKKSSEEETKKKIYSWKPFLDDKKNLMLKKGRKDNAETLIVQIMESGYEVSEEMKTNLRKLVENMDGKTINLTQNAGKMSGDFKTTIELISAQAKLKDKDNNCVNLALVTLDEFRKSKGKTVSKNFSKTIEWKGEADETLKKNFTSEDQTLKGGNSVFVTRNPKIENPDKNITHASRFFLKGKNGENFAVHKYSSGDKSPLRIKKSDDWVSGKIENPTSIWNPAE